MLANLHVLEVEITDAEAAVLKHYSTKFTELARAEYLRGNEIGQLCISWNGYFHALCVKYQQNPFGTYISYKTKKFGKIDEDEDK